MIEETIRWTAIGPGEVRSTCPWCGATVEFRPKYRDWYCAGTHLKPCGHNASVPRQWCDCSACEDGK